MLNLKANSPSCKLQLFPQASSSPDSKQSVFAGLLHIFRYFSLPIRNILPNSPPLGIWAIGFTALTGKNKQFSRKNEANTQGHKGSCQPWHSSLQNAWDPIPSSRFLPAVIRTFSMSGVMAISQSTSCHRKLQCPPGSSFSITTSSWIHWVPSTEHQLKSSVSIHNLCSGIFPRSLLGSVGVTRRC